MEYLNYALQTYEETLSDPEDLTLENDSVVQEYLELCYQYNKDNSEFPDYM